MPPSFPTTSPVATAAARILAAYLSNHHVSPAEAAGLSSAIAETLARLTGLAAAKSEPPHAPAAKTVSRRRAKPRTPPKAQAVELPEAVADAEPESEPEAALVMLSNQEPQESDVAVMETEPAVEASAEDLPRKRKRPSRPRSRRGKSPASATDGDEPDDDVAAISG